MELNRIKNKIEEVSGDDILVAEMLKEIFGFERQIPGWYKEKYKEIIEKYAKEESRDEN